MSKFTKDKFERAITTGAKVLGGKLDVEVVFVGSRAFTNGKRITIPSLPEDAVLSMDQVNCTRGYYHHEAAHIRFTDFDVYQERVMRLRKKGENFEAEMCNVVEDCFIEREWMKEFAGSHKMLSVMQRTVDQKVYASFLNAEQDTFSWQVIGLSAIQWRDSVEKQYDPTFRDRCLDLLTPEQRRQLDQWYEHVRAVSNTQDAMRVAKLIKKEMLDEDFKDTKQKHKELNKRLDNWKNLTKEEKEQLTADMQEVSEEAEDNRKEVDQSMVVPTFDLGAVLSEDDSGDEGGKGEKEQGKLTYRPFTTQYDKIYDRHNFNAYFVPCKNIFGDVSDATYHDIMNRHMGSVSVMQRKIQRAFGSHDLRGWEGNHETGRLDARRLTAAYQGDPKVYRTRTTSKEVSTSVQIVVDGSSSMNRSDLEKCVLASATICKTLEAIGGECEIIFMPGHDEDLWPDPLRQAWTALTSDEQNEFSRANVVTNICIKGFDDKLSRCRAALGNIVRAACGGTPLHEAIHQSYRRLLNRNTNRKVQLLITDGGPDNYRLCKEAVEYVQSKDIEVVGIGIGANHIGNFCDRSVVVYDVSDFASDVMDDFARMLLGERFKATNERRKVA